ncbi:hypothetical protein PHBOTO_004575 [Pseudozyma hubeiensis]|nr:hypothetical protein PHBOTO_004575 [Pseudozyma hubeiensis]
MATLQLQRPRRLSAAPLRRSPDLSGTTVNPASPTIIRTNDFILLPSVPTHEPEDNLPSPMALQQQFAIAAHNDAQARRSRQNSMADDANMPSGSRRASSYHLAGSNSSHDNDELEEIVEPEPNNVSDPASTHDALRDVRNQQLEQLQSILNSFAEVHFESGSSSHTPDAHVTQILDDMFASLRLIAGHSAPLSPTFARSPANSQMSDADRLVLLADRLALVLGDVHDAQQAGMLANLTSLIHSLFKTQRRLSQAVLESPPRTPLMLAASRRRSMHPPSQHSPQASSHRSLSRTSSGSTQSHITPSTSSDEATPVASRDVLKQHKVEAKSRQTVTPVASTQPEQHHVDGSVFDMATVRREPSATSTAFSLESLYVHQPSALGLVTTPQSPRSDQASRSASVAGKSDSTVQPNRKRFSVLTDSAASTALPSYASDGPGHDLGKKAVRSQSTSEADDLPQYDETSASGVLSADVKVPVEPLTLLERRRAKLAAQHSAYAARTPEDLAVVQSSIDRLSTVMPQLDDQRALSPEEQRQVQLQDMIGRLSESSSKRMDDQRSEPPTLRAPRPAPPAPIAVAKPLPQQAGKVDVAGSDADVPRTPMTPSSMHSGSTSSSRRGSLIPQTFARKLSLASIGNAIRRASIYDTTKVKPKEDTDVAAFSSNTTQDATVRRRRAATTHDSRAKSDIADTLSSMFNEGKPRAEDKRASRLMVAQTGFRAIDFADDTPKGREDSLMPRASVEEEEDDSMLDDYTFASIDTSTSNHRMSMISNAAGSPRSPVSWSSGTSRVSSRRSSQLTSNPATPTWPKSPFTPDPIPKAQVEENSAKRVSKSPTVTFADLVVTPPSSRFSTRQSLPSEGWEELVDAWMCHADQELNRSLTETAVKFAGRVGEGEQGRGTVWVGDTYFLVPKDLFDHEAVEVDDESLRCTTCRTTLGSTSQASSIKLNKFTVESLTTPHSNTWLSTLLSTLHYSAASHGSRRFLVKSPSRQVELWLFSRATFATSLSKSWTTLGGEVGDGAVWKGSKVFFRQPSGVVEEGTEAVELPEVVFGWLMDALQECHESLPSELGKVLPEWNAAYLASVVDER